MNGGQRLNKSELDAVAGYVFNAAKPNALAVAKFVELTGLSAQNAAEMMGSFAFHDGGFAGKLFNEETSSHGEILS
jgi:hypothetical protein